MQIFNSYQDSKLRSWPLTLSRNLGRDLSWTHAQVCSNTRSPFLWSHPKYCQICNCLPQFSRGYRGLILTQTNTARKTLPGNSKDEIQIWIHCLLFLLARRDDCPESYCHDPGVGVTPQGKNFNLGYIFWTIRDRMLIFHI
jgi:hypothetical protein